MAVTALDSKDKLSGVISDFSKNNKTVTGAALKDTETTAAETVIKEATPDKTKTDEYLSSLEEESKDLTPEQKIIYGILL